MELIKAQKYLLMDDGVVFIFEGEDATFPKVAGEQPLALDYVDGTFCLMCGPYSMALTDEILSHLHSLSERGGGSGSPSACTVVGARTSFLEYKIEPLFDFCLGWSAIAKMAGIYEVEQKKREELEKTPRH